jgi:predicted DNA-binding transcriptional regulator AlpA
MVDTSLLRLEAVVSRRGRSKSQLYRDIAAGTMTPPVRCGEKKSISIWPAYEIDALNRAEIAGAGSEQLRALVKQLLEQRTTQRTSAAQVA